MRLPLQRDQPRSDTRELLDQIAGRFLVAHERAFRRLAIQVAGQSRQDDPLQRIELFKVFAVRRDKRSAKARRIVDYLTVCSCVGLA